MGLIIDLPLQLIDVVHGAIHLCTAQADSPTGTGCPSRTTSARRRISLSRAQVDGAMNNINELKRKINNQPHTENGQADGMILSNIKPNSIFRRMGLRNGDILTAIDGRPIT